MYTKVGLNSFANREMTTITSLLLTACNRKDLPKSYPTGEESGEREILIQLALEENERKVLRALPTKMDI